MSDRDPLSDQTVIVTGGAGGLGKAIAVAYLERGASVSICDKNATSLETCKQEWADLFPGRFFISQTDVTDKSALELFFEETLSKLGGRLDILVNNAGILDDFTPAGACEDDVWDRTLAVNLTSAFQATKLAVNIFSKQTPPTGGLIINIGSECTSRPTNSGVAYTVSKAGLAALTKHTAAFYASQGISCMCLLLGAIVGTNIYDSLPEKVRAGFAEKLKAATQDFDIAKHSVTMGEVARFCLFLSDGMAAGFNGNCMEFRKNWAFQ